MEHLDKPSHSGKVFKLPIRKWTMLKAISYAILGIVMVTMRGRGVLLILTPLSTQTL